MAAVPPSPGGRPVIETGVYLPALFAGFGIAFAAGFVWGLFYVGWVVLTRLLDV